LIGQHDISKHSFVVSPSNLPLSCFSHSLSPAPSVENGNQRQLIFTKYNQWKPTTVDGNQSFSFVVFLILIFISSSAGRHFSAYDDHSISSLFPTFINASALHLLPLHLTASVKPSTPFGFLFFPSDEPDPPLFVTFPLFLVSRISPQGGENRETLFRFQFLFLLAITTPQSLVVLAFLLLAPMPQAISAWAFSFIHYDVLNSSPPFASVGLFTSTFI